MPPPVWLAPKSFLILKRGRLEAPEMWLESCKMPFPFIVLIDAGQDESPLPK